MLEFKSRWGLLLAAAVCTALSGIHYHFLGPMMKPLGSAYGWTRGETSFALTISSVLLPAVAIMVGWLGDRFGMRRVILPGTILFGIAFSLLGLAGPSLWSWYALYAIFSLVGFGSGIVLWSKVIVENFEEHRGLALAICASAAGVLVTVVPSLVLFCLVTFGVRGTFVAWGTVSALIMFPVAWLFCPRNETRPTINPAARKAQASTVKATLGLGKFWILALAIGTIGMCNGPLTVQLQPILTDSGMTAQLAARAAFLIGPTLIIARLGVGLLFDRFPARAVTTACFLAPAVTSALLVRLDGSFISAVPAAIVAAIALGAEVDVAAYLTSRCIAQEHYGFAYGAIIGIYGLGLSLGSTAAGFIHDVTKSHNYVLVMMAVLSTLAAALVALLGPIRRAPLGEEPLSTTRPRRALGDSPEPSGNA